jgi:hypothetical protein
MSALVRCLFGFAVCALSLACFGQSVDLKNSTEVCRVLNEPGARLACYDAAFPPPKAATPATPAAQTAKPLPRQENRPATLAEFGLSPQRPEAVVQAIETSISGRFEGWEPGTKWLLANGQIWEVVDGSRASYDLSSPAVRIKRGLLGSFFIEIDGVGATPRVRRLK